MNALSPTPLPPRLVPDEPLPPYSYVTGRFPHPIRDPAGHSFGHTLPPVPPVNLERFADSRAYLFGCDLFNHGYYWEAHELWEGLWHACGRHGVTADFLKGLIKLAAGGVKAREGRPAGVQRHAKRAGELFASVRATVGGNYLGLELDWLVATARAVELTSPVSTQPSAPVERVFEFALAPRFDSGKAK